jgi:hypothetical protein
MKTRVWSIFAMHAVIACGMSLGMGAVVGTDVAACVLLAVSLVAWWIAWRSIEMLVFLGIAAISYSLCSDTRFPSVVAQIILAALSAGGGFGYWAPATLKIMEKKGDGG